MASMQKTSIGFPPGLRVVKDPNGIFSLFTAQEVSGIAILTWMDGAKQNGFLVRQESPALRKDRQMCLVI